MQTLAKYKKICYHKQADFDNDKKRPHGQAVKTLPSHGRICGSIPHGATKKIQHHLVWCCIFLYAPERKRRGNLFAVVRQFAQANSCRRLPLPALLLSCRLHMGNGNFRMGLRTSSVRGNDAATCLPSFVNLRKQILAVGSHRPHLYFPISYIWETATSAWGYILLRCVKRRGNLFAVVRICVSKFCRSSPFYGSRENSKGHANGNGNFRMGLHTSSLRGTTRQLLFYPKKDFSD